MKRGCIGIALLIALAALLPARAETNAFVRPPRAFDRQGDGGTNHGHGFRGGPGGDARYVEMWMEQLKQRNPAEFERVRRLREENPEEFRKHLRAKLADLRGKGGLSERPAIQRLLKDLPDEDREWLVQRIQGGGFGGELAGFRSMSDFRGGFPPEMERGEMKARELLMKTRAASGAEREELKKELRSEMLRIFDLREKARTEQLRQAEEQVAKIRKQLEERAGRRDQIIEEKLEESLKAEAPAPR